MKVYIGIAFMPGKIGREQAEEIAQTVSLLPAGSKNNKCIFKGSKKRRKEPAFLRIIKYIPLVGKNQK
ncbi:MAG: hypothetical protein ACLVLH_18900 [Eisenbergiella massiliensis]